MSINISEPSLSVDEINVPEISELSSEFTYNYYTVDERISEYKSSLVDSLQNLPRYVTLRWRAPTLSNFEIEKNDYSQREFSKERSIENNFSKIMSEDRFLNKGYMSHIFSDITSIEQGGADLENYSRLSQDNIESIFKMSQRQIQKISSNSNPDDEIHNQHLSLISSAYSNLANMPKDSLGLRVYDESGRLTDNDGLLKALCDSLSISVKINNAIIQDIFRNSKEKIKNLNAFNVSSSAKKSDDNVVIQAIGNTKQGYYSPSNSQPIKILGYIIERYWSTPEGYAKQKNFFIEDPSVTSFVDKTPLYGITYVYTVRAIFSVKMLTRLSSGASISEIYISSKPIPSHVNCLEFVPPPEPENLKFTFDYDEGNLIVQWDPPVNPQKDIKQYQVFRRKSINFPFELIAQYGFDRSYPGWPDNTRYTTGEIVDANNFSNTPPEYRNLITSSENLVCFHRDKDFSVDAEFFQNESFIYSICSIDAHGMISNYSEQHEVVFDSYKNKIISKVVCGPGSPKPYPNMKLRVDAFKDSIRVSGDETKELSIYFSPEYLKIKDKDNKTYKIIEAITPAKNNKPYYVLQLINLDNQKSQLIKININDTANLTSS